MNIFYLDENPRLAAIYQCDKHVVKMVTETAQLLSTAHRVLDGTEHFEKTANGRKIRRWKLGDDRDYVLYKASHVNHPSNQWIREGALNYRWLYNHFVALSTEYNHRYGRTHASWNKLGSILFNSPKNSELTSTPIKLATGDLDLGDPVATYRQYYRNKQERFKMVWTNRNEPEWFYGEAKVH